MPSARNPSKSSPETIGTPNRSALSYFEPALSPATSALVFFETEEDYRQGDETLSAMPASETPGKRTSVTKYDVAIRRTA
jgi:hypothetical protein